MLFAWLFLGTGFLAQPELRLDALPPGRAWCGLALLECKSHRASRGSFVVFVLGDDGRAPLPNLLSFLLPSRFRRNSFPRLSFLNNPAFNPFFHQRFARLLQVPVRQVW